MEVTAVHVRRMVSAPSRCFGVSGGVEHAAVLRPVLQVRRNGNDKSRKLDACMTGARDHIGVSIQQFGDQRRLLPRGCTSGLI